MLWLPHDKYENINKNKTKNINKTDNFKWGPVGSPGALTAIDTAALEVSQFTS